MQMGKMPEFEKSLYRKLKYINIFQPGKDD